MMRKLVMLALGAALVMPTVVAATGCGSSAPYEKPDTIAPPPTEKDEKSSDKG